jgi:hypothetical protein
LSIWGCATDHADKVKTDKFSNDLRGLYAKVSAISSQTRASGNHLGEAEFLEIIEEVNEIAIENNIAQTVANSGYYADAINGNIPSPENSDIYDWLSWLEGNGTPAMIALIAQFENGEEITLEQVLATDGLLPNEELGLIVILGLDDGNNTSYASTSSDCQKQYNTTMSKCRRTMYWSFALTGVFTLANPYLGFVTGVATTIDFDNCSRRADDARYNCQNN